MFETRLFVGNLPNNVHENDLRSAFSNYGEVTNLDIKSKSAVENDPKKFAFITISSANSNFESCIQYFSSNDFEGSRLYVTRARESFLERLQRERQEVEKKEAKKKEVKEPSKKQPVIKLGDNLNPKKRKVESKANQNDVQIERDLKIKKIFERNPNLDIPPDDDGLKRPNSVSTADKKKQEADKKRMESMRMKRQEFKNKQHIIKTGLIGIDKVSNKKLRFSDNEENEPQVQSKSKGSEIKRQEKKTTLFHDDDSDGDVNFEIKKQFEGKKGQKVLDLQSRYKSDKRFVLDERFIEDDQQEEEHEGKTEEATWDQIDVNQGDEKSKQIKILEDVLGVSIKSHANKPEKDRKTKPNMGMIRFDPMNPEHAKFVVPIQEVKQETKKNKKLKAKESLDPPHLVPEVPKIEVSQEQFYKSDITKNAFEQPATSFSLRNLFAKDDVDEDISKDQEECDKKYIPIQAEKQQKVKNPLDPGVKNPFVYDSSESEGEEDDGTKMKVDALPEVVTEAKAVWKENLFFSKDDHRLRDGLAFFTKVPPQDAPKERRQLKSVMMKRIYNTERKNQMFRKKIGGRKKSMKKSYMKKS